jgi:uncharacterized membrane protein (DUF485 family)
MQSYEAIERNPKYQELVRSRRALALTLSALMLAIYMGFILLVAYAPKFLATPLGAGVTTIGIPIGIFVIISAFILTGIYIAKANSRFDSLTRDIVQESK